MGPVRERTDAHRRRPHSDRLAGLARAERIQTEPRTRCPRRTHELAPRLAEPDAGLGRGGPGRRPARCQPWPAAVRHPLHQLPRHPGALARPTPGARLALAAGAGAALAEQLRPGLARGRCAGCDALPQQQHLPLRARSLGPRCDTRAVAPAGPAMRPALTHRPLRHQRPRSWPALLVGVLLGSLQASWALGLEPSLVLACALITGLALSPLPGLAQDAPPKPMMQGQGHQEGRHGPRHEAGPAHGGTRHAGVEQHIQTLQQRLRITAAQAPQWDAVAQAMRESARELDTAMARRGAQVQAGPVAATDSLKAYAQMAQVHADSAGRLASAFAPLYAAMSAEQQKLADDVFAQRMRPGPK